MVKILGKDFLLGCDPEVFVVNKEGKVVGAHDLMPGSKTEPYKVKDGMVQVDGMALEFGVDPCENKKEFISKVKSVMKTMAKMLPKGYSLLLEPIVVFSNEEMARAPEHALELGCDPDYSGYTLKKNPSPKLPNPNMRSAGGHVHVGWGTGFDRLNELFIKECSALAVELDYYLGVPSLSWDSNIQRRAIYGGPGAFRPKVYGMEYRTLSNQWLKSDETIGFVFDAAIKAIKSAIYKPISTDVLPLYKQLTYCYSSKNIIEQNKVALGVDLYNKLKRGFNV